MTHLAAFLIQVFMKRMKSLPSEDHWNLKPRSKGKASTISSLTLLLQVCAICLWPQKSLKPHLSNAFFWRVYYPSAVSDLKEAVYWESACKVLLCHTNGTNIIPWTHIKAWKWNHSSWNLGDETPPNTDKLTRQRLLSGSSKLCTQHLFAQWYYKFQAVFHRESSFYPFHFLSYIEDTLVERKTEKFKQNAHVYYYSHFSMMWFAFNLV